VKSGRLEGKNKTSTLSQLPNLTTSPLRFNTLTLIEAINSASEKLASAGISAFRFDAELLLCHTLEKDRAWLLAHIQDELADHRREIFEKSVNRRVQREPLQYIIGKQEFWGLEFRVSPDVLIPRPETELIIETVLDLVQTRNEHLTIIDLCSGSGCIAISLATELTAAQIIATDRSGKALDLARENARTHNLSERIRFLEGDLFMPWEELDTREEIDIIVSNPPYVPSADYKTLQPEVKDYEPQMALISGQDGTEIHQRIIHDAPRFLKSKGTLIMEMGIGQAEALVSMVRENGNYSDPIVLKDLAGIERVIVAQKREGF
jgi:release factor glutamine methyltransferase